MDLERMPHEMLTEPMTWQAAHAIANRCTSLTQLHMAGCERVRGHAIADILRFAWCVCVCVRVCLCVCVCVLVYCENVKVSSLFVRIPSMDRADTKTRAGLCTSTQQANHAHHQLLLTLTRVDLSACTQLRDLDVTQCHQLLDANLRTAATHFTRLQVCVCVCVCV